MREKKYAEQMGLFVAAHRSRPPSWKAIPAEVRREVIRLLSELLRDSASRRAAARGKVCDE